MTERAAAAEGWYRDPYGIHQDRWFSAGTPTSLVRDGDAEGRDDPPAYAPPVPLEEIPDNDPFPEDALRRADDAEVSADQGDRPEAFDRVLDAEMPGFAGEETG